MPHSWTLLPAFAILLVSPGRNRVVDFSRGPSPVPACAAPEYRQFDFWLGNWDTFEAGKAGKSVARNRVTRMLDSCAIREVYEQNDGLVGESFNAYDAERQVWHQSWVTNRGQWLVLEGHLAAGRMVLTGTEMRKGKASLLRAAWSREGNDVHEVAERSGDAGKTWQPVFDIIFRPH